MINRRPFALVLAAAALLAPLNRSHAADSLSKAGDASEAQLQQSLQELTALREQISAEKLPLTRQLGELEERLTQLRRANDDALRALDTGALESSTLTTETKLRDEELTYMGSLLDEYIRGFETKLAIGELPRYREPIELAKAAQANNTLSPMEKFEHQLSAVSASIDRVADVIGGTRFPGQAVNVDGVLTQGKFAVLGPLAFFASTDGVSIGVAMPQSGSTQAAVRPIDAAMSKGILGLINDGSGTAPLDPTRGSALKELVKKTSIVYLFKKGGPIMWPLLVVSILALATVIERVLFLFAEQRKRDDEAVQDLLAAVSNGDIDKAIKIGRGTGDYVARAMTYALQHREKSIANALMYANAQEVKRFSRGLPILDTAITIAPLLGLLGTVTGMMNSFSLIGGDLSAPGAITGGIAEALIATAFGLCIAIVCLVPFNLLNSRIEESRHALEAASTQLELMVHPPQGPIQALAMAAAHGRG